MHGEFKTRHLAIIVDTIEDETQLMSEQEALDKHDDEVYELNLKLQALFVPSTPEPCILDTYSPNYTVLE